MQTSLPDVDHAASAYTQQFVQDMQGKVFDMSSASIPRMQNTVLLLKNELQIMVEKLKPMLEKM